MTKCTVFRLFENIGLYDVLRKVVTVSLVETRSQYNFPILLHSWLLRSIAYDVTFKFTSFGKSCKRCNESA